MMTNKKNRRRVGGWVYLWKRAWHICLCTTIFSEIHRTRVLRKNGYGVYGTLMHTVCTPTIAAYHGNQRKLYQIGSESPWAHACACVDLCGHLSADSRTTNTTIFNMCFGITALGTLWPIQELWQNGS